MADSISVRRRLAEARSIVVLVLFLLPALEHSIPDPVSWEEAETLVLARQFADPGFIQGDWFLDLPQPVRRPYQILIYPLVELFALPTVSLLARLSGYLFVAAALGLIAARLGLHAGHAAVVMGSFLWLGQSLAPGEEWIFRRAESKVFGYGLTFFALHALLARRLALSGFLAGLAATMHVIVGIWGTLALGLAALSRRIGSWRARLGAAVAWCAGGAGAIYFALSRLGEPAASAGFDADRIYVAFRMPHHNDPSFWDWPGGEWLPPVVAIVALAALALRARSKEQPDAATVAQFALWTLLPYAAGLLSLPFDASVKLLHLYPFRVASTVVLLFGLMLAVPALFDWTIRRRARPWVAAACAAFFAANAGAEFADEVGDRLDAPAGGVWRTEGRTQDLRTTCEWIRANTAPDALLISSPFVDTLLYHCRRPVAVTFRMAPASAAAMEEWYRRITAFNGGEPPQGRGYRAAREVDRRFRRLSTEQYRGLAREYGGDYLVVRKGRPVDLPLLFREGSWAVYAFSDAEKAAGGFTTSGP